MPFVSLGHPDDGTQEDDSAKLWLSLDARGIDTAFSYHNQDLVGKAVRASGVPREEIFVTTKVPCKATAEESLAAVREDLKELQMDYVDLMLIHFPCSHYQISGGNVAAWQGLQKALELNLTRSIGVSNFNVDDVKEVLAVGGVTPAVNQCQMSIGSHDDATISFCQDNSITYEAYSPLRHVDFSDATINEIATAHGKSVAQVALRWINQQGVTLATSPGTSEQYAREDADVYMHPFDLTDDEMNQLRGLGVQSSVAV